MYYLPLFLWNLGPISRHAEGAAGIFTLLFCQLASSVRMEGPNSAKFLNATQDDGGLGLFLSGGYHFQEYLQVIFMPFCVQNMRDFAI